MDYWTRKYTPPSTASSSNIVRSKLGSIAKSLHNSQEKIEAVQRPFIDMKKVV